MLCYFCYFSLTSHFHNTHVCSDRKQPCVKTMHVVVLMRAGCFSMLLVRHDALYRKSTLSNQFIKLFFTTPRDVSVVSNRNRVHVTKSPARNVGCVILNTALACFKKMFTQLEEVLKDVVCDAVELHCITQRCFCYLAYPCWCDEKSVTCTSVS